ncbi:hypothetical protein DL98DRAFT_560601 [Cadophora sp. DSE1049]|nr:hypothetical protein DL98DRAFT_560601 [Cadophora sp. DSE1049]
MAVLDFHPVLSPFVAGDLSKPENSRDGYAAVIVEAVGSAGHITELWKYVQEHTKDEEKQLVVARRIREGLLKTSPLAGFPKGINCLAALRSAVNETSPSMGKTLEADKSMRADHSASELEKRGGEFFDRVYGKVADRVLQNMALSSGGDLDQFAKLSIYGELMAEERILNAKETGLMEFIVCYVSSAAPQAKGHMYESRNLGNGKDEIKKGIKLSQDLAEALGVKVDTESQEFIEKVESW